MNHDHARLRRLVTALVIVGISLVFARTGDGAEPADTGDEPDLEVLTRGPVHEAFAGVVTFNPEPGVVVPKAPPESIEELPPDEKPEGDNVAWIPGYWVWDDERDDFLWVSGVWRALPPGRQWVPGYWVKAGAGFQWISGYWADARASETAYLPAPPATLEAGPNIVAPSPDHYWVPGCWVWYDGRYAWRPGYWVVGQPDWVWCPAYYTWTPRGYVFVEGYWDYAVVHRGVLFAPVYYATPVYVRHGYYYSPTVVIDLTIFPDHLFLRPHYQHCYFGDYYALSYYRAGYFASFSFHSRHRGFDPIYAHRRWQHRHDPGWRRQVITTYRHRREHEDARPPRTWTAQRAALATAKSRDRTLAVATSFDQVARQADGPVRFRPVARDEKEKIVQHRREVVKSREERRALESSPGNDSSARPGGRIQPSKVRLPRSPIVAPPTDAPPDYQSPPRSRRVPRAAPQLEPRRESPGPDLRREDRPAVKPRVPSRREPPAELRLRPGRREPPPELKLPAQRRPPPAERQSPARRERPPRRESPPAAQEKARDVERGEDHRERPGQDQGED